MNSFDLRVKPTNLRAFLAKFYEVFFVAFMLKFRFFLRVKSLEFRHSMTYLMFFLKIFTSVKPYSLEILDQFSAIFSMSKICSKSVYSKIFYIFMLPKHRIVLVGKKRISQKSNSKQILFLLSWNCFGNRLLHRVHLVNFGGSG